MSDEPSLGAVEEQDVYNAERLVEYYGERIRYVPEWKGWVHYTGTHWEKDPGGIYIQQLSIETSKRLYANACAVARYEARQEEAGVSKRTKAMLARAVSGQNAPRIRAMAELARSNPAIICSSEVFDRNAQLLACKNGTLDLRTGEMRKNSPHDNLTKSVTLAFAPNTPAPQWEKFLARIIPDVEVRGFLKRFLGYCLTGEVGERLFCVLYGTGQNGKSVVLEVMQRVLGSYAVVTPPTLLMAAKHEMHPTQLTVLHGARLAVGSEVREGRAFDEEVVKRLTGNDRITCRGMHENFWSYAPTHKLIIAANHRPRVTDTSASFWDRVCLVPFTERITDAEKIPNLQAKLFAEEGAGILSWALAGLQEYVRDGMKIPTSIRNATLAYRASEDSLSQFFTDRCEFRTDYRETSARINSAAANWASRLNLYPPQPRKLGERLRELGCTDCKIGEERGWRGIRIVDRSVQDTKDGKDPKNNLS